MLAGVVPLTALAAPRADGGRCRPGLDQRVGIRIVGDGQHES